MKAMLLDAANSALRQVELPMPIANENEVLLNIKACGVCRTDLHVMDGELENPKTPLILGHEIVGIVIDKVQQFALGQRLGAPWLGHTRGHWRKSIQA
jgi:alcohol dehydrogenase, propanol-preferring